ncbi:60S ribosomal protein L6-2-like [Pyrus x bretschneideri]|uniref:60S ribosomal protein L6-2-like n=1 Tax=Pyrus x bretschneideri TaxID=225117 RepID=UPI00202F5632|nr:60S ribosomal protein L6-2-like [Pyrus x bretschneideri]
MAFLEVQNVPQAWSLGSQGQKRRRLPSPRCEAGSRDPSLEAAQVLPRRRRQETPRQQTRAQAHQSQGPRLYWLEGLRERELFFLSSFHLGYFLLLAPLKLRRVNQSYVIATSTKVDISGLNVEIFDEKYFAKEVEKKKKKGEGEFFEAEKEEKNVIPLGKKGDQKSVDASLIKSIEAVPDLKTYLAARFSLKAGMKPHELVTWLLSYKLLQITFCTSACFYSSDCQLAPDYYCLRHIQNSK